MEKLVGYSGTDFETMLLDDKSHYIIVSKEKAYIIEFWKFHLCIKRFDGQIRELTLRQSFSMLSLKYANKRLEDIFDLLTDKEKEHIIYELDLFMGQ